MSATLASTTVATRSCWISARSGDCHYRLQKYTMKSHDSFIHRVADLLHWPDNPNMRSMAVVGSCLWMASNPKLGATTCAQNGIKFDICHRSGQGRPAPAEETESSGVGDELQCMHTDDIHAPSSTYYVGPRSRSDTLQSRY